MPSSYSNLLGIELIANGEQSGNWGNTTTNTLGTLIEQAIAGYSNVTASGASYNLVNTPAGTAYESRSMALNIQGTLSVACNIICPSTSKLYVVRNDTAGAQSIIFRTAAGSGITIANGATAIVLCNGTDVIDPFSSKQAALGYTPVNKAGDTMTGQLNLTSTNNTPFSTSGPAIAIRNASTVNSTYAAVALNNAASNSSALLFTEYAGTNASRFAIATNPGTSPTSLTSRFTVNADGSFSFLNNSSQLIAVLDSSGNLSVKGNVTAYAAI